MDFKVLKAKHPNNNWDTVERTFNRFGGVSHAFLQDLVDGVGDKGDFVLALLYMVEEGVLKVTYFLKKDGKMSEQGWDEPTDIPDEVVIDGEMTSLDKTDLVTRFSW